MKRILFWGLMVRGRVVCIGDVGCDCIFGVFCVIVGGMLVLVVIEFGIGGD